MTDYEEEVDIDMDKKWISKFWSQILIRQSKITRMRDTSLQDERKLEKRFAYIVVLSFQGYIATEV